MNDQFLLDALVKVQRDVSNGQILDHGLGICYHARWFHRGSVAEKKLSMHLLRELSGNWPGFSGFYTYPVPHETLGSRAAYHDVPDLWVIDTEYGKARRELLLWLIETLEKLCTKV